MCAFSRIYICIGSILPTLCFCVFNTWEYHFWYLATPAIYNLAFKDDDDGDEGDDWSGNVFVEISSKCFPLKEGAGSHSEYIRTNNGGNLEYILIPILE